MEIISVREAAELMRKHRSTIYRYIENGTLTIYENGVGDKGLSKEEVLRKIQFQPKNGMAKKEPGSDG